ncbi:hypothetical protein C8R44DRAFT_18091 [Mycena epipterygia]|nr:hypothetical protein C8R44DRAFT_18091 [Mycena epipterygia]
MTTTIPESNLMEREGFLADIQVISSHLIRGKHWEALGFFPAHAVSIISLHQNAHWSNESDKLRNFTKGKKNPVRLENLPRPSTCFDRGIMQIEHAVEIKERVRPDQEFFVISLR